MNTAAPTVALLPWGDLIEDFLDSIGLTFEAFRDEMTGGWLFGYVEALKLVGVRAAIYCVSARVASPERHLHKATGVPLWLLPAGHWHRWTRRGVIDPYGWNLEASFGPSPWPARPGLALRRAAAPYLATPLGALAEGLRREGCTAILCQEYEYARFDACVWVARRLGLPVFATFQGANRPFSAVEAWLRPHSVRSCAGLIVASSAEARRVQERYGLEATRLARIFNPLDLRLWQRQDRTAARAALGIPLAARVVVWHGRVVMHTKGLDVLAEAWERLCRGRPGQDLRLLLIGTGIDAARLEARLAPLRGVIRLNSYINDRQAMARYLSAADLYTLPSRHEGFAVAPLEAMACGLPVVAADAPGVPDLLAAGDASGGRIVPRGDAVALADALGCLIDDDDLCRALGRAAREHVQTHFSLEAVGPQLRDFLLKGTVLPTQPDHAPTAITPKTR